MANGLTYYNLLRVYWKLHLSSLMGTAPGHLFLAVLQYANDTGFKDKLDIPNSTLMGMSGINVSSSFFRARGKMTSFRLYGEELISYEASTNVRQCGTYTLYYQNLLDALSYDSQYGSQSGSNKLTVSPIVPNMGAKTGAKVGTYIEKRREEDNPPPPNILIQDKWEEEAEDIFSKLRIKKRSLLQQYPAKYICDLKIRHRDKLESDAIDQPGAYMVALIEDQDEFQQWSKANE